MKNDKRNGEKAIPDNVGDYLNELQQVILEKINKFGWTLQFVRRFSNEKPVIVIADNEGKKFGVMEEGGAINFLSGVVIRSN